MKLPEDQASNVVKRKRSLLAAQTIDDLIGMVEMALYEPPSEIAELGHKIGEENLLSHIYPDGRRKTE